MGSETAVARDAETACTRDAETVCAHDAKARLRADLKALRAGLDERTRAEADAAICSQVVANDAFARADVVFSYLSIGTEVDTRAIVRASWGAGKAVAVPRVVPGTRLMRWYRIADFGGLVRSGLGVYEPPEDAAARIEPGSCAAELAIVPGLAFDARGFRIGYGGGFYDSFLATFGGVSMGLCRRAQLIDDLGAFGAIDAHDLPVDIVVVG